MDDIEPDRFPREVLLFDREVSPELTALFKGYAITASTTTAPSAATYLDRITGSNVNKVLAVSYRLKHSIVLRLVVFGLIISLIISSILGVKMSNIQVAFTTFGAMTLVMTVPLNVIFWMTK